MDHQLEKSEVYTPNRDISLLTVEGDQPQPSRVFMSERFNASAISQSVEAPDARISLIEPLRLSKKHRFPMMSCG
jgi:hypothetical protein